MFAGVDQSILRSTRNPLLNQDDSRCTTSRSSAARSLLPFIMLEQIGAHRHQIAGAARRAVEPADQFLPSRFGSEMQVAGVVIARLRAPGFDRLGKLCRGPDRNRGPGPRRTKAVRRHRDDGSGRAPRAPSRCRRLRPGPRAAPRIVRSARRRPAWFRMDLPRRSSVRPRSEIVESRSEKKALAMGQVESSG